MKKNIAASVLVSGMLIVTGCATMANTTIFPNDGGVYQAISTSSSGNAALKDSIKKAQHTCQQQGKSFVVISQQTSYNGVDPNLKKMANLASDTVFFSSGAFVPTGALSSDEDYKVTTVFKCQ